MDEAAQKKLEYGLARLGLLFAGDIDKPSAAGSFAEVQISEVQTSEVQTGMDDDSIQARLISYIQEIELWNPGYKLVASGDDLVSRHVLDSLSGLSAIAALSPRRLADVGSGAGFPGIPLAVCMPGTEVTLIEKMGRRAGFLRTVSVGLGLKNVEVIESPVEKVASKFADSTNGYDVVTFRAWSALNSDVLDAITGILAPDGKVAAYKGRRDTIDSELNPIAHRLRDVKILPLPVFGGGGERNLVVFGIK